MNIHESAEVTVYLGYPGLNTRIEYGYVDATNMRRECLAVLQGRITEEGVRHIVSTLGDDRGFVPGQVGLQDIQGLGNDRTTDPRTFTEDDHGWHYLMRVSYANMEPTERHEVRTVEELLARWPASAKEWDPEAAVERLEAAEAEKAQAAGPAPR